MRISFYSQVPFSYPPKIILKSILKRIALAEKKTFKSLSFIFCSDEFLLQINKDFLSHNYYTDIITFNLSEDNLEIEGEIYISIDRVKENADLFNTLFINELNRVIIHGLLHLCGYGDKTISEKKIMTKTENHYLLLFNVSRGTNSKPSV